MKMWSNPKSLKLLVGNWHLPKRDENTCQQKDLDKNAYSRSIHNRPKLEVTDPNVHQQEKGRSVISADNGIILNNKKKQTDKLSCQNHHLE